MVETGMSKNTTSFDQNIQNAKADYLCRKKMRRMKPISTGFTPLPECKPGRKSVDELMLR